MTHATETVATVLERDLVPTVERWMKRVDEVPNLLSVPLSYQDRTGHLPQLIRDLIIRLRLHEGAKRPETSSAHDHGKIRFNQGYSVSMLVEESRLLQVSIFDTLHRSQKSLDPDLMMLAVITIADECDAQLKHTVETFMALEERGQPGVV
jgi:hypothetical protein